MGAVLTVFYGIVAYTFFLATFLYAIGLTNALRDSREHSCGALIVAVLCLTVLDRYGIVMSINAAMLVAGVAALGLVAGSVVQQIWPLANASVGFALEGQMSNNQATTEETDIPLTVGIAATAIPMATAVALPLWSYGFFRAHYKNKATFIDAQVPAF
jgi:hypothetical protein